MGKQNDVRAYRDEAGPEFGVTLDQGVVKGENARRLAGILNPAEGVFDHGQYRGMSWIA